MANTRTEGRLTDTTTRTRFEASAEDPAAGAHARLCQSDADAPDRAELEAFVQAAFGRRHGATVRSFMPTLLGLRDGSGRLRCVAGFRPAASGPLYLEHYLDRPVELELAARVGGPVERSRLVEVGHLAGGNCRAAVRMVALLPRHLLRAGHEWIVFTATSAVHGILTAMGAPLVELARADAGRVAATADDWGAYYHNDPRVFAGYLPDGLGLWRAAAREARRAFST